MSSSTEARQYSHAGWRLADVAWLLAADYLAIPLLLTGVIWLAGWLVPGLAAQLRDGDNVALDFWLTAAASALLLLALRLILGRRWAGWRALGWRRFNLLKAAGYIVAAFVAFYLFNGLLEVLVKYTHLYNFNQAQSNEFTVSGVIGTKWALVALVLIPPVVEETVYRGLIFPALAARLGTGWGMVLSSLLFGLAHGQVNVGVYTFALGMIWCFMYRRLGSIVPGMVMHMLNNLLAYWLMLR